MSEFPQTQPAFTLKVEIDPPFAVGSASRKSAFQIIPMIGGTIQSAESFSPALDAELVGVGNDYIRADADGKHLRLDAHGVVKTKDEALIYLKYTGVITFGDAEGAVLSGTAADGSTPFGNSFTHITFETGDERYKELENRVFVGQGRFNVEKGKPIVVEYRIGQVVLG
ncbi:hypothetical protein BDW59DRAFT_50323 [Aspergillus cavernicola]|uniref:Uncharacterized protein n=1 Tax=Aspergillus cavernicola TaxID=176166 RepID=A0ABR4IL77_9EURO